MGCPSEVYLGYPLVFSICTHDPDTGVLTDADSLPIYRIYEDDTATPILTGTMPKLDDVNTVGFYAKLVQCITGNGFESERSYTVYIEATVDSDTGGISFGFTVKTLPWSTSTRTLTQPAVSVAAAVIGDVVAQIRATTWSFAITGMGSLSDRTKLYFTIKNKRSDTDSSSILQIEESAGITYLNGATVLTPANGTLTVDDAVAGNVTVTLTHDESDALVARNGLFYDFKKITATGSYVLTSGRFNISDLVTERIS